LDAAHFRFKDTCKQTSIPLSMSAESEQARRALSSTQKRQHTTQSSGHLLKPADSSKQPKRLWKHRKDDCFKFQQRTARSEGRLDRGRRQLDPASPTGCCNCCCTLLRRRVCWGCSTADLQIVAGISGSTWGHGEHIFCSFLLATDPVPQLCTYNVPDSLQVLCSDCFLLLLLLLVADHSP